MYSNLCVRKGGHQQHWLWPGTALGVTTALIALSSALYAKVKESDDSHRCELQKVEPTLV
jgi:hypothetical protein